MLQTQAYQLNVEDHASVNLNKDSKTENIMPDALVKLFEKLSYPKVRTD